MWRKTLEYLGLQEERDEYDEMPERFAHPDADHEPAMHDTTGPIPVVRVDGDRRSEAGGGRPLRPVADQDLTEPVHVPDERSRPAPRSTERRDQPAPSRGRHADNVRHLRPDRGGGQAPGRGRRVAIVAVGDYETGAREVGQRFRGDVPVVFDLTDAPPDDRRRVLDFVAGVTYALHGEMMKVGARSFLIVPEGGEVPAGEWERLAGLGYRP